MALYLVSELNIFKRIIKTQKNNLDFNGAEEQILEQVSLTLILVELLLGYRMAEGERRKLKIGEMYRNKM
jgi:hypothetical protein